MSIQRVASQFQALFETGTLGALPDHQLLDRFSRLGDREAFEVLVGRHGPMVMGVCRRVLGDAADADDAFQATFLVLIRRARALTTDVVLAAWLHGVATKVARRARSDRARRAGRERTDVAVEPAVEQNSADFALKAVLDEEVERLPWKYRVPVALCYLEGLTHEEAARRLDWPIGSVKGRLARAKTLLGSRLARRGVTAGAGIAAVDRLAEAAVSDVSRRALVRAAERAAWGGSWKSVVSDRVVHLTGEVLTSMLITKLKTAAFLAAAVGLTATGVGFASREGDEASPSPSQSSIARKTEPDRNGGETTHTDEDVERALRAIVSCEFSKEPLKEALQSLANQARVDIVLDPKALSDVGITAGVPVDLRLRDSQLKLVLKMILSPLQLTYAVEDGVILVTYKNPYEDRRLDRTDTPSVSAAATVSPEDRFLRDARRAFVAAAEDHVANRSSLDRVYRASRLLLDAQQGRSRTPAARKAAFGEHLDRMRTVTRADLVDSREGAVDSPIAAEARALLAEAELWYSRGVDPGEPEPSRPGGGETGAKEGDHNPRSQLMLKKLEEPLTMSFPNETPLEDVLKYIKQATETPDEGGLAIYVDPFGLQEAEKSMTAPVSLDLAGVPLRRTLQLLLEQLGLVYFVEDGMVVITAEGRESYGLKPTMAKSTQLDDEVARAKRGELGAPELNELIEKLKLIQQVAELHRGTASHATGARSPQ